MGYNRNRHGYHVTALANRVCAILDRKPWTPEHYRITQRLWRSKRVLLLIKRVWSQSLLAHSLHAAHSRHALHHHVMLVHHLAHHLLHELHVLVYPLAHLIGRHAAARLRLLHLRHHVLHQLHVLLHHPLALRTLSGLRGGALLLRLRHALDELLLRFVRSRDARE